MTTKNTRLLRTIPSALAVGILMYAPGGYAADDDISISPEAELTDHDSNVFKPDPDYGEQQYDAEAQKKIYGGKYEVDTPRPLLELGRKQYQTGPLTPDSTLLGENNLLAPAFAIYGDLRTAVAYNDFGQNELGQVAMRLNLDIDAKLTATERLHFQLRPLDEDGRFSRVEFSGDTGLGEGGDSEFILNSDIDAAFFEGDLGSIVGGFTGKPSKFDLPFAAGLTPLFFQNGVWLDDAIVGTAFSVAARNSPRFDISNYDVSVFAGFDKVTNQGIRDGNNQVADEDVNIYGVAGFFETRQGYAEIDYAFIDGRGEFNSLDHHSFSAAFSKRIGASFSTSARLLTSFGQDLDKAQRTADGTLLIWENSIITKRPSTFIPYINLFAGFDRPQSAARSGSGVLKNIGINFESDGMTGFPLLDDSGHDSFGGALGLQNLFSLNQQLVFEIATVQLLDDNAPIGKAKDDQWAFGIRYQRPLNNSLILRADAMHAWLEGDDVSGVRVELRKKF